MRWTCSTGATVKYCPILDEFRGTLDNHGDLSSAVYQGAPVGTQQHGPDGRLTVDLRALLAGRTVMVPLAAGCAVGDAAAYHRARTPTLRCGRPGQVGRHGRRCDQRKCVGRAAARSRIGTLIVHGGQRQRGSPNVATTRPAAYAEGDPLKTPNRMTLEYGWSSLC